MVEKAPADLCNLRLVDSPDDAQKTANKLLMQKGNLLVSEPHVWMVYLKFYYHCG